VALGRPQRKDCIGTYSLAIKILTIPEHWSIGCLMPLDVRNLFESIHKAYLSRVEPYN